MPLQISALKLAEAIQLRLPRKNAKRVHADVLDFLRYLAEDTSNLSEFFTTEHGSGLHETYIELEEAIDDFSKENNRRLLLGKLVRVLLLIDRAAGVLKDTWEVDFQLSEVKRKEAFALIIHSAFMALEFQGEGQAALVSFVGLCSFRNESLTEQMGANNSPIFQGAGDANEYYEVVCDNPLVWGFKEDASPEEIKNEMIVHETKRQPVEKAAAVTKAERKNLVAQLLDSLFPSAAK